MLYAIILFAMLCSAMLCHAPAAAHLVDPEFVGHVVPDLLPDHQAPPLVTHLRSTEYRGQKLVSTEYKF